MSRERVLAVLQDRQTLRQQHLEALALLALGPNASAEKRAGILQLLGGFTDSSTGAVDYERLVDWAFVPDSDAVAGPESDAVWDSADAHAAEDAEVLAEPLPISQGEARELEPRCSDAAEEAALRVAERRLKAFESEEVAQMQRQMQEYARQLEAAQEREQRGLEQLVEVAKRAALEEAAQDLEERFRTFEALESSCVERTLAECQARFRTMEQEAQGSFSNQLGGLRGAAASSEGEPLASCASTPSGTLQSDGAKGTPVARPSSPWSTEAIRRDLLQPGCRVKLVGLTIALQCNGQEGEIVGPADSDHPGQWIVRLDESMALHSVKRENFCLLEDNESEPDVHDALPECQHKVLRVGGTARLQDLEMEPRLNGEQVVLETWHSAEQIWTIRRHTGETWCVKAEKLRPETETPSTDAHPTSGEASCLPEEGESAPNGSEALRVGTIAWLQGLEMEPHLNGELVVLQKWDDARQMWRIQRPNGDPGFVKAEKLSLLPPPDDPPNDPQPISVEAEKLRLQPPPDDPPNDPQPISAEAEPPQSEDAVQEPHVLIQAGSQQEFEAQEKAMLTQALTHEATPVELASTADSRGSRAVSGPVSATPATPGASLASSLRGMSWPGSETLRTGSTVVLHGLRTQSDLNGALVVLERRGETGQDWAVRLRSGDLRRVLVQNITPLLEVGSVIEVVGLGKQQEYNGRQGKIFRVDSETGRYWVQFPGNVVKIMQACNARPVSSAETAPSTAAS
mmetsp:Transcript_16836/g.36975  ORF Transcript_16836/g.36975 Transcript_16836/m.36975 type:complete len:743 (+) Transcript_16836:50-2278(+)